MRPGFRLFARPGSRIAATLAAAVLGTAGAAAALRYPDGLPGLDRPAIDHAASAAAMPVSLDQLVPVGGELAAMAAYAGRFPDLVRNDVYGLGRARVAQLLTREPQPGLREAILEETLAESYDLDDTAVVRYVDRLRADPVASSRLMASEASFQRRVLSERLGVPAAELDPAIVHVAVRFGTRAGSIMYLVATGAGPAQLPSAYPVDGSVLRAIGARSGIEALQAFSGDLAIASADALPGPTYR
ncbi:hypothetical protein ACLBYM_04755 [Methylobacterium fujisawaense]